MELLRLVKVIEACPDTDSVANMDAATATAMARNVEFVISKTYEKKFPELPMAEGAIIPIDSTIPASAETYTYYVYEGAGIAEFLNSYAQSALPRVGEAAKRVTGHIEAMGNAYGYNWDELSQAAVKPGFGNLETRKVKTSRRGHAQKQSDTGWYGNTDLNFYGLLTHPNITVTNAAVGAGLSTAWEQKTFEEILADFRVLINTPRDITNKLEIVDAVLLPDASFTFLNTTVVASANSSNITIIDLLLKSFKGITIEGFTELQAANSDGALTNDVALAYKKDPDNAALVIPVPYTAMAPHWDGLELNVATISKFGGVKMVYPLAFNLMTGVAG